MIKLLSYLFLLVAVYGLSYRATSALFSSSSKSTINTFAASAVFPSSSLSPTQTPILTPTPLVANHIVISEVQIQGVRSDDDFIELYNPTASAVNLKGKRLVVRTGGTDNTDTNIVVWSTDTFIQPFSYYLWANTSSGIIADSATTDVLASTNSIALRNGPADTGTIIDAVNWGTNPNALAEGAPAPIPPANQSIERKAYSTSTSSSMMSGADVNKGNGFDTDNNSTDFIARTTSQPQNSSSTPEAP